MTGPNPTAVDSTSVDWARADYIASRCAARPAIVHDLKTWPESFAPIQDGRKLHEVRKADRDFRVGDTLHLREWDRMPFPGCGGMVEGGRYTGRALDRLVTYISAPGFSPPGMVIMSIAKMPKTTDRDVSTDGLQELRAILNPERRTYHWLHPDTPHDIRCPQYSDRDLAGKVRMLIGLEPDHEMLVTAARDRIMHLSEMVEAARAACCVKAGT